MTNFKTWFEAVVSTRDIERGIAKTLEFKLSGRWRSWDFASGTNWFSFSVQYFHPKNPPGTYFYLSGHVTLAQPVMDYDSITGDEGIKIKSQLRYIGRTGKVYQVGVRDSGESGGKLSPVGPVLRTPLELGEWAKHLVENFEFPDEEMGGDDDMSPYEPSFGGPELSKV